MWKFTHTQTNKHIHTHIQSVDSQIDCIMLSQIHTHYCLLSFPLANLSSVISKHTSSIIFRRRLFSLYTFFRLIFFFFSLFWKSESNKNYYQRLHSEGSWYPVFVCVDLMYEENMFSAKYWMEIQRDVNKSISAVLYNWLWLAHSDVSFSLGKKIPFVYLLMLSFKC